MSPFEDSELVRLYKEINERRNRMTELLRERAAMSVDPSYRFTTGERTDVTLGELFDGRDDLIVVHNMGRGCPYCTLWADGLNGILPHIRSRAAIVLMNGDSPDIQKEFASSRGWSFRMVSDAEGRFTEDMGFSTLDNQKRMLQPGFSTFHRNADGTIVRAGTDAFGPGDFYMGIFPMFDLLKDGQAGWHPKYTYNEEHHG